MRLPLFLCLFLCSAGLFAQVDFFADRTFTRADTLRGALRPERTSYDVTFYHIDIDLDMEKKAIAGSVQMDFTVVEPTARIQVDLFENMTLDRVVHGEESLDFEREGNAIFIELPAQMPVGTKAALTLHYHGRPLRARNAPWDGGFVWKKDKNGQPWIGVACEGTGASLWWPNKDHLSDEPDSMRFTVTVPEGLMAVSNGNLRDVRQASKGRRTYDWFVSYPINNYNLSLTVGDFVHFDDTYTAQDGEKLALDYYVLPYNLAKAKKQFAQVKPMLACYEQYLGKYPFWEDGFAMVETPYLGMEHQSGIAYGNQFKRGYLGGMIPSDMDWDYIIIHESGHEYFGNSISVADHAEMWIHESFTTYLEAVYVECQYSYEDAIRYLQGQRDYISNKAPMVGPSDVNFDDFGSSDHYYKGAWFLQTLRHALNDDEQWWAILKGFYQDNERSIVSTKDFIDYMNKATGRNWDTVFQQYLHYPELPTLLYRYETDGRDLVLSIRWDADAPGFDLPVLIRAGQQRRLVYPKKEKATQVRLENVSFREFKILTDRQLIRTNALEQE